MIHLRMYAHSNKAWCLLHAYYPSIQEAEFNQPRKINETLSQNKKKEHLLPPPKNP